MSSDSWTFYKDIRAIILSAGNTDVVN